MHIQKRFTALIGNLLFFSILFSNIASFGQVKNAFYIEFKDKNTAFDIEKELSQKAVDRRAKFNIPIDSLDHPVNPNYIKTVLEDTNLVFRYDLKWHNAIVVESALQNLDYINLHFVKTISYIGKTLPQKPNKDKPFYTPYKKLKDYDVSTKDLSKGDYGKTYGQNKQIGAVTMHKMGFDGNGVTIAVFDAGFYNINKIPAFVKHQGNRKITYGADLVDLDNTMHDKDNHGTAVTSCIGSYDKGKFIGSAPGAHLILFRTENAASEFPIEELNWCKAAELADSAGVDMITSSLGYTAFDDISLSHTHEQLTGRYSYVSLAARVSVAKGIFVLNSAGNEGDDEWFKIGTPADVPEVLTIGAVDKKNVVGGFSSRGYNATGHIKPDVCALGVKANVASTFGSYYQGYGTSYATPIAAGGVACLVQALPNSSPQELANAIRQSALSNRNPDSMGGYGVAQMDIAFELVKAQKEDKAPYVVRTEKNRLIIYNKDATEMDISLYSQKKILWIFKKKKLILADTIKTNVPITYINLDKNRILCSKKYTIKLNLRSDVENYTLKHKDLKICAE
jgi:serine protease AprX